MSLLAPMSTWYNKFPKMAASSVFVPRVSFTSPRSASRSDPGSYQITASSQSPEAHESLCAPFKSEVSISPSSLGLPKVSPAGLQRQVLWGFIFPVQDPWAQVPSMGLRSVPPLGEPLQL